MNVNYVLERKSVERIKGSDTKLTRLKHKFHMYKLMVYRGSSVPIVKCEAILAMTRERGTMPANVLDFFIFPFRSLL